MGEGNRRLWKGRGQEDIDSSAGSVLRHELFNKITPVLLLADQIEDSDTRLLVQASCLDMVTVLEEIIGHYSLDGYAGPRFE